MPDKNRKFGRIRWVWFDLDDTLVDFHTNSRAANRIIFEECGLARYCKDVETWIRSYEVHNKSLWDRYGLGQITQDFLRMDRFATPLRPGWDGNAESLEDFSRELDRIYLARLAEQTAMIDGAKGLLDFLRAHEYNIGILSNGFKDVQHHKLANTGLNTMVDLTVLSDDIGINKPDPRLYDYAMERSGDSDRDHHMMIGDNLMTDIAGAIKSGWNAVHLDPTAEGLREEGRMTVTPRLKLLEKLF